MIHQVIRQSIISPKKTVNSSALILASQMPVCRVQECHHVLIESPKAVVIKKAFL